MGRHTFKERDNWLNVESPKEPDRFTIIDGLGVQVGPGYPTLEEAETALGLFLDPHGYMVAPLLF